MAQNREIDDLPTATAATTTAAAAAAPSGCGSIGPGHGPDTARMERGEVTTGQPAAAVAVQVMRSGGDVISLVNTTAEESKEAGSAKRAVNRCSGCRKRVGLTGFRCRCGDLFCSVHRYSDRHECSYDYKAAGRAAIARQNPVVRAAKILKV